MNNAEKAAALMEAGADYARSVLAIYAEHDGSPMLTLTLLGVAEANLYARQAAIMSQPLDGAHGGEVVVRTADRIFDRLNARRPVLGGEE